MTALAMAVRVQQTLDEIAAAKGRPPRDVHAEAELCRRLHGVVRSALAEVDRRTDRLPRTQDTAQLLASTLDEYGDDILAVLVDEVGDEAARAIERVERAVAAKQLPDKLPSLNRTLSGLRDKLLARLRSRTADTLVDAAASELPRSQLRRLLNDRVEGVLSQLCRHTLGDARNEATEVAEQDAGVTHHRWISSGDDDVRPAHARVDGEVVEVGELFSNGWRRPGGVGCRCRLEPVTDTDRALDTLSSLTA